MKVWNARGFREVGRKDVSPGTRLRTRWMGVLLLALLGATSSGIASGQPLVGMVKTTNGQDANDPNGAGVPNIAPGSTVTWTYAVTNTGTVAVPRANVVVTDNSSGVTPQPVLVGGFVQGDLNTNDLLDPTETWIYQATGTALNLVLPPPAGVTTVPNSCTANGTQPPRTAYTNVGTVTIPGSSATDPSSYCNSTSTPTATPTPTPTSTSTPTATPTPTSTSTPTATPTPTPTPTSTSTPTATPTPTSTSVPPTATQTLGPGVPPPTVPTLSFPMLALLALALAGAALFLIQRP